VNRLVCIGFLGYMNCYLNLSVEEARERFRLDHLGPVEPVDPDEYTMKIIEFKDAFGAYDVWGDEPESEK
jgi:hypothetical protein